MYIYVYIYKYILRSGYNIYIYIYTYIYIYIFVRVCERWLEELTLCKKAPTMHFRFYMEQEAENERNEPHY